MSFLKHTKLLCAASFVAASTLTAATVDPCEAVIPKPSNVEAKDGNFSLNRFTKILVDRGSRKTGQLFSENLQTQTGLLLQLSENKNAKGIRLTLDKDLKTSKEGYSLTVSPENVVISANSTTGLFYGAQTLIQMTKGKNADWTIPCAVITDSPRFGWRGLMIDEARHFHGKRYVKQMIDTMALHKMNVLHWHLTDDEGWRIEIKRYPKLTSVGAWRGEGTEMPEVKWRAKAKEGREDHYGGYYTQEEIKEIVAYAKDRHIEIVPEIDVPGHVTALVTAYPELLPVVDENIEPKYKGKHHSQSRTLAQLAEIPTGYRSNALSIVNPKTYEMVEGIFAEVFDLFPSKYIHIGADEVHTTYWEYSPEHIKFMDEKGFTDPRQLQNYFTKHLEKYLKEHGRTIIGWNEMMKGGEMSRESNIMAWISIGAGINAAKAGYPTIMAVAPHNYFDMGYPGKGELRANGWAGQIDSKKAYEWNPLFKDKLTEDEQKLIKGVHACVWSEYVYTPMNADYKFWPRACSTAEVGWTPQDMRSWDEYHGRLEKHLRFLDNLQTTYRVMPPKSVVSKGGITVTPGYPNATTVYTLDGSTPTCESKVYKGEVIDAKNIDKLKVMTLRPRGLKSIVVEGAVRPVVANWNLASKKGQKSTVKAELKSIDQAGKWTIYFTPDEKKRNEATVKKIVIKAGDKMIVDEKVDVKINKQEASYSFNLKDFDKSATYTIETVIQAKKEKGGKSMGTISADR